MDPCCGEEPSVDFHGALGSCRDSYLCRRRFRASVSVGVRRADSNATISSRSLIELVVDAVASSSHRVIVTDAVRAVWQPPPDLQELREDAARRAETTTSDTIRVRRSVPKHVVVGPRAPRASLPGAADRTW